ncbi:NADPH-dependent 3-demethoxyubiquinone 3-hydroxylase, mitochondrial isoform 2-T3 [Rhynchonycteris naso]
MASRSLWRLRALGPLSVCGGRISVRFCSSGMTLDGINRATVDRIIRVDHAGAGTALLGKEGAMACTVAVEESIAHHYNNQIRTLMEEDSEKYEELLQLIKKFRDEELEHHDIGLEHDAELAPAYAVLKKVIQAGCGMAIYLSERF